MNENTPNYDPGLHPKLTDWANEPSLQTLKGDLEAAKPSHDAQISRIQHWNDLMEVRGAAKPPQIKGRSSVQPKLIRRQAEWRYSALTEPFLSTDKLFKVSPTTFEDDEVAKQNELVLNWQFRTKINRVKFIDDFVRSTVDEGTSIVRLGWKRATRKILEEVPVWQHFEMQSPQDLEVFQQALELKTADPRTFDEQTPPEIKAAIELYEETGQLTVAVQTGTQQVEVEKVIENRPTVEVMNPANVYIDPSCGGDMEKALFVVVSFETNLAELMKEGKRYKNLDKVNWEGASPLAQPDHETSTPNEYNFKDRMRKKVVAYEYWGFYDIHGKDELVPFVATWIGDVLIRMELNPFPDEKLPFVVVPYLPVKRALYGEPDAELLEENQRIIGAVTRGMIDLLGRSANGQQGFAKGMLDPLNRRRYDNGQDYEFNPNVTPSQGLIEHKYPEIPQSALLMLNLQQNEAEGLTGVKGFSSGLGSDALGKVATGIRGVLDAASKREAAILRRLAKGIVEIGQKIMAMNHEFLSDEEVIRITNKPPVIIKREDLKGNFDIETEISTAEMDNQQSQDLAFLLQTMGPDMDPEISMMIMSEIARLKRLIPLAEKLKNWRPQPNPVQEQLQQLEIAEKQATIEKLRSEIEVNRAKIGEIQANAAQKEIDAAEQVSGITHARDLQRQSEQARGNQNLQITKALTSPRKEGEKAPDVLSAIGFNQLSDKMREGTGRDSFPADPFRA